MAAPAPASTGEKQTIQARHGVATFVPKGHTIKIINTYGKQVVDTWAFALHAPPEDSDIRKGEGEAKEEKDAGEESSKEKKKSVTPKKEPATPKKDVKEPEPEASSSVQKTTEKVTEKAEDVADETSEKVTEKTEDVADETSEKVTEKVEDSSPKKGWSAYIPSVRGRSKAPTGSGEAQDGENKETEKTDEMAKSWSSYLPSVRSKGAPADETKNSQSKGWSSYIPSGVGYSSYMPSQSTLSAFASSHTRDPTKSYAEQLYDFSKTPVGAAGLSG
jgi:hypothetical protein